MAIDTASPRSRRALLGAGLGALAATVVGAVGRPEHASAANTDPLILGGSGNTATSPTGLAVSDAHPTYGFAVTDHGLNSVPKKATILGHANASYESAVLGYNEGQGGSGVIGWAVGANGTGVYGEGTGSGVYGHSVVSSFELGGVLGKNGGSGLGVVGASASGLGVLGFSGNKPSSLPGSCGVEGYNETPGGFGVLGNALGIGVLGQSTFDDGVQANTQDVGHAGVRGTNGSNGTGVFGFSGGTAQPIPPARTGVYGVATQAATAKGVWGHSTLGQGVHGDATSGIGVAGAATTGTALSGNTTSGYALSTSGRVRMGKVSGVATIAVAATSVTVTPGVNITAGSFVLLTPEADPGTRRLWFTKNATAGTITIHVSSAATTALPVGWLLLG